SLGRSTTPSGSRRRRGWSSSTPASPSWTRACSSPTRIVPINVPEQRLSHPAGRTEGMAGPFVPITDDPDRLRGSARSCQGCGLYRDATQTVFGEGPPDAHVVMVGEQPGDIEDRRGAPFVGPAGKVLDRAIVDAGLDRAGTYVTNAVKHFKHRPAA